MGQLGPGHRQSYTEFDNMLVTRSFGYEGLNADVQRACAGQRFPILRYSVVLDLVAVKIKLLINPWPGKREPASPSAA